METPDPGPCTVCGLPADSAPRLFVQQRRHLEPACIHVLALCREHGAAVRAGALPPQQVIYAWATREHEHLYQNVRLALRPLAHCLACNQPLIPADAAVPTAGDDGPRPGTRLDGVVPCSACGAQNVIGTALGHSVAVRLDGVHD